MGPTPLLNPYHFLLSLNLTTVGPHVSFDQADVAVDLVPPVSGLNNPVSLTCGPHTSGLTLGDPVDLLTSALRHADAIFLFWNLVHFINIQEIPEICKNF